MPKRLCIELVPIALAGAWIFAASGARAQGMRGEVGITAGLVEYRSVLRDSLPESLVPGSGIVRTLADGTVVTCIPGGNCYWYRGGDLHQAFPLTEDIDLVAWPGARGVSAQVHLRGRYGSNDLWPRSNQEFAVLNGWIDFERRSFRIRAGRQNRRSGLGTEVFDGGALLWRQFAVVQLEAFAGRSLADALAQPRTGFLLQDADALAPDESSMLWGLAGRWRAGPRFAGSLTYQRNIRMDRVGLYSERMALDAWWRVSRATVEANLDFDLASGNFDEAGLRLQAPVGGGLHLAADVRHWEPFFELWTIWGAFSPVGFDEVRIASWWDASAGLRFDAGGSYRNYRETFTGLETAPIEGDGWRGNAGARWTQGLWHATAAYSLHWGFGAYRSSIDASGFRQLGRDATLGLFASATQQFMEFRFGDGRTQGGGAECSLDARKVRLLGRIGWYWQDYEDRPGFEDYGQWRGSFTAAYRFVTGANPDAPRSAPGSAGPQLWNAMPDGEKPRE